jgi:hypothetical protein
VLLLLWARNIREGEVMAKWIVITEVESEIDPALFNYVNGTTLISSQLKEDKDNERLHNNAGL